MIESSSEPAAAVQVVHIFESPGSVEYGFTRDEAGANLPTPQGEAWRHWRTVDIGEGAERQVGVDPAAIAEGLREKGYFISEITGLPTI